MNTSPSREQSGCWACWDCWRLTVGSLAFRNSEALLFFAAFSAFGLGLFSVPQQEAATVYLPNLVAILALLGEQRLARKCGRNDSRSTPVCMAR